MHAYSTQHKISPGNNSIPTFSLHNQINVNKETGTIYSYQLLWTTYSRPTINGRIRTLNLQEVMALIRSTYKQKRAEYQHMSCSSCMIYEGELSPFAQFQFPKHQALDRIPKHSQGMENRKINSE